MKRFSLISVFLLCHGTSALAAASSPFDSAEMKTLRNFEKQGYIKHATCLEIANSLLTQIGLPLIGQSSPVQGDRLNLDRREERASPPQLIDGLIRNQSPYMSFQLEAKNSAEGWNLKLTRELRERRKPAILLETTWKFHLESRVNHPSCEVSTIEFKGSGFSESMDIHECLTLIELDSESAASWIKNPHHFAWAKEDCELGLHYFKAGKEALLEDAIKKIR